MTADAPKKTTATTSTTTAAKKTTTTKTSTASPAKPASAAKKTSAASASASPVVTKKTTTTSTSSPAGVKKTTKTATSSSKTKATTSATSTATKVASNVAKAASAAASPAPSPAASPAKPKVTKAKAAKKQVYRGPKFIKIVIMPSEKVGSKDLEKFKTAFGNWLRHFEEPKTFTRKNAEGKSTKISIKNVPVQYHVAKTVATFESIWEDVSKRIKAAETGTSDPNFHVIIARGVERVEEGWENRMDVISDILFDDIMDCADYGSMKGGSSGKEEINDAKQKQLLEEVMARKSGKCKTYVVQGGEPLFDNNDPLYKEYLEALMDEDEDDDDYDDDADEVDEDEDDVLDWDDLDEEDDEDDDDDEDDE